MSERQTDNWIQQNIPGGLNSPLGEQLDNMMGGNPNPTADQFYGGALDVGGYSGNWDHRRSSSPDDDKHHYHHGHRDS